MVQYISGYMGDYTSWVNHNFCNSPTSGFKHRYGFEVLNTHLFGFATVCGQD